MRAKGAAIASGMADVMAIPMPLPEIETPLSPKTMHTPDLTAPKQKKILPVY